MGLIDDIVKKKIDTTSKKALIDAAGIATASVIATAAEVIEKTKAELAMRDGIMQIRPSRSSNDYQRIDTYTAINELFCCGFETIELRPYKSLGAFTAKKYGYIRSITINGKSSFDQKKKFPATSYILIEYFDFKKPVDLASYGIDYEIVPGFVEPDKVYVSDESYGSDEPMEEPIKEMTPPPSPVEEPVYKFCTACGAKIDRPDARFCAICGHELYKK